MREIGRDETAPASGRPGARAGPCLRRRHAGLANILIQIDKPSQTMTVSVDGKVQYRWRVSTGATGFSTPPGTYKPFRMEVMHYSQEWDNAGMPHSIFFTSRGHAVHGSNHPGLGTPVSHGCVRLTLGNAATLYQLVGGKGHGGHDGHRQRPRSRRLLCRHPDTEAEPAQARIGGNWAVLQWLLEVRASRLSELRRLAELATRSSLPRAASPRGECRAQLPGRHGSAYIDLGPSAGLNLPWKLRASISACSTSETGTCVGCGRTHRRDRRLGGDERRRAARDHGRAAGPHERSSNRRKADRVTTWLALFILALAAMLLVANESGMIAGLDSDTFGYVALLVALAVFVGGGMFGQLSRARRRDDARRGDLARARSRPGHASTPTRTS